MSPRLINCVYRVSLACTVELNSVPQISCNSFLPPFQPVKGFGLVFLGPDTKIRSIMIVAVLAKLTTKSVLPF